MTGETPAPLPSLDPPQLERIRLAMLAALRGTDGSDHPLGPRLRRRLDGALDVRELWLIRAEFGAALAAHASAPQARRLMAELQALFEGFAPVTADGHSPAGAAPWLREAREAED